MEETKVMQKENKPPCKGKQKQIYMMSDIEEKAIRYCKKENVSFSLLIRLALEEFLGKRGS